MGRPKHPEQLLDVAALVFLTGQHKNTVLARFQPGGDWYEEGLFISGEYRLPVSAYNRWLDNQRLCRRKETVDA